MENKEVQKIKEYLKVLSEVNNTSVDREEVINAGIKIVGGLDPSDPDMFNYNITDRISNTRYQAVPLYTPNINQADFTFREISLPVNFDEDQLARLREAFNYTREQSAYNTGLPLNIITGARGMDQLNNALDAYNNANSGLPQRRIVTNRELTSEEMNTVLRNHIIDNE